ncbi:type 4a pilus biogenesis protein PilO [Neisseria sp. Ec49-e6-T10]|uniref:type 4a pilus biogenesis protein PilO n=1 Tax=Neisseria sp. Ec49-e6-T10 TaxID=3140744 RepID=UPI003EBC12E7
MKNFDLSQFSFSEAYKLPAMFKMAIYAIVVLAILGVAYLFYFSGQLGELDKAKKQELEMKEEYKTLAVQAVALPLLKKELEQIQESFGVLLKQLPSEVDIPNVLQELHQAAMANEVVMDSITPLARKVDGPIETVPYNITVQGGFEQLAKFVSDVGQLSRIVTLTDVNLAPNITKVEKDKSKSNDLFTLKAVANTYRALDDSNSMEEGE